MDIETVLQTYQNKIEIPRWILSDGRIVIGEEVDSENHLLYVIKNNNTITLEPATTVRIVKNLIQPAHETVTIKS